MNPQLEMDRATKVIRSTDYDALSCRVSAHTKNYIQNAYLVNVLQGFERFLKYEYKLSSKRIFNSIVASGNKMPIINRGTYIRTVSIDIVIEKFMKRFENQQKRIINLGAGSDTRVFKILEENDHDLEYVEFDFPESTKLKHAVIKTDPELSKIVGLDQVQEIPVDLETFYNELSNSLIVDKYKLIDLDLRNNSKFEEILKTHFDSNSPTLIISECMLCYANSNDSTNLINSILKFFNNISLLIYDPIGGTDNFGNVMIENLKIRSISMPSLLQFNTLDKYAQRLKALGFDQVKSSNMYSILNNWIDVAEQRRISKLEFLDEIEELKLLLEHYCILVATSGFEWKDDLNLQFDLTV